MQSPFDRIYGREASERADGRRLARATINKSMREKGTSVGGRNITSLFCSILKCRLMLSIKRTINSASAEIIDDFLVAPTELRRWRHGPRFSARMMQFPPSSAINFYFVYSWNCLFLSVWKLPEKRLVVVVGCQYENPPTEERAHKGVNCSIIRNYTISILTRSSADVWSITRKKNLFKRAKCCGYFMTTLPVCPTRCLRHYLPLIPSNSLTNKSEV